MASIRGKNTKPELVVRRFLFRNGYRFRIHVKTLPGHPDVVIPCLKTIIFVNGCFWHGHKGCTDFVLPKSNLGYWKPKLERNIERDHEHRLALKQLGWHVIEIWECQLKKDVRHATLEGLLRTLNVIKLHDMNAKVYNFDYDEERSMAAEDWDEG